MKAIIPLVVTIALLGSACSKEDALPQKCENKNPAFEEDDDGNEVKKGNEWKCWQSGAWQSAWFWKGGKKHGKSVEWHADGKKWKEGNYKDGKEHGIFVEWGWGDGQKIKESEYRDGVEIRIIFPR